MLTARKFCVCTVSYREIPRRTLTATLVKKKKWVQNGWKGGEKIIIRYHNRPSGNMHDGVQDICPVAQSEGMTEGDVMKLAREVRL
jgi:hypothetical protein